MFKACSICRASSASKACSIWRASSASKACAIWGAGSASKACSICRASSASKACAIWRVSSMLCDSFFLSHMSRYNLQTIDTAVFDQVSGPLGFGRSSVLDNDINRDGNPPTGPNSVTVRTDTFYLNVKKKQLTAL